jgi:hypothetical protein
MKNLLALFLLAAATLAHADEPTNWVNFGGLSYHIPAKNYNDANYGFGVEHALNDKWGVVAGTYYNSLRVQAYYVGARYTFKKDCFWVDNAVLLYMYQQVIKITVFLPFYHLLVNVGITDV